MLGLQWIFWKWFPRGNLASLNRPSGETKVNYLSALCSTSHKFILVHFCRSIRITWDLRFWAKYWNPAVIVGAQTSPVHLWPLTQAVKSHVENGAVEKNGAWTVIHLIQTTESSWWEAAIEGDNNKPQSRSLYTGGFSGGVEISKTLGRLSPGSLFLLPSSCRQPPTKLPPVFSKITNCLPSLGFPNLASTFPSHLMLCDLRKTATEHK